jgi:hypothetical protein
MPSLPDLLDDAATRLLAASFAVIAVADRVDVRAQRFARWMRDAADLLRSTESPEAFVARAWSGPRTPSTPAAGSPSVDPDVAPMAGAGMGVHSCPTCVDADDVDGCGFCLSSPCVCVAGGG